MDRFEIIMIANCFTDESGDNGKLWRMSNEVGIFSFHVHNNEYNLSVRHENAQGSHTLMSGEIRSLNLKILHLVLTHLEELIF